MLKRDKKILNTDPYQLNDRTDYLLPRPTSLKLYEDRLYRFQ